MDQISSITATHVLRSRRSNRTSYEQTSGPSSDLLRCRTREGQRLDTSIERLVSWPKRFCSQLQTQIVTESILNFGSEEKKYLLTTVSSVLRQEYLFEEGETISKQSTIPQKCTASSRRWQAKAKRIRSSFAAGQQLLQKPNHN